MCQCQITHLTHGKASITLDFSEAREHSPLPELFLNGREDSISCTSTLCFNEHCHNHVLIMCSEVVHMHVLASFH